MTDAFLPDFEARAWRSAPAGTPAHLHAVEFYLGMNATRGSDICLRVLDAERRPARGELERIWRGGAASPVLLLVARYLGPNGPVVDLVGGRRRASTGATATSAPRPLVVQGVPKEDAAAFCRAVLGESSPAAAGRLIARWLDERATDLPGLKNDGLFARHALIRVVPERPDWTDAVTKGRAARPHAGRDLIRALGFGIDDSSEPSASVLLAGGKDRAVALFLEGDGNFDDASTAYGAQSPVSHALAVASRRGLPWVILTRGHAIRLHPVSPDVGSGRRGRSSTYVEINLDMLPDDALGYLALLFDAEALVQGGTVEQILETSSIFAADLGARLRERVYHDVIPRLAKMLGRHFAEDAEREDSWLTEAYYRTMVVLFRLLFVAYAEDRGLLPYGRNQRYTKKSLKALAQDLTAFKAEEASFDSNATDLWEAVRWTWTTLAMGNRECGVPPYNGGLFDASTPTGQALATLELTNAEIGPVLADLLVDHGPDDEPGPVDFRSLSVREFGTIYEGLLESELSVAETDLTLDSKGFYVPAKAKQTIEESAGDVYFHHRSGARKATGSYFTKPFAVEHLLEHALEPAVSEHLERVTEALNRGDDASATASFFNFRCVDLAMGSGHFLVAAVDRIEAHLIEYLDTHPIPGVTRELEILRTAALDQLHGCADDALIEDAALLRRQIARRCIYGVDRNPIAVELARLAIWIHTFVPGLPLSFLDHNLVVGNSLTGIGTLEEAGNLLQGRLAEGSVRDLLAAARPALERLRTVTEATVRDVAAARDAHLEARRAVQSAVELFDLLVLDRAELLTGTTLVHVDTTTVSRLHSDPGVTKAILDLEPLHFPAAFPEVFLGDRPGFDCILGNPPWEKLHVEEHQWWGLRAPGLRSLPVAQMNREIARLKNARPDLLAEFETECEVTERARRVLMSGPYPELGASHPDLYKAFAWRFWALVAHRGTIGVVLPRAALSSSGMAAWRSETLDHGDFLEITLLVNNRGWVFEDVHPQWTTALISIRRTDAPDDLVAMRGPFSTLAAYRVGQTEPPVELPTKGLKTWTSGAAFPLIPGRRAGEVFLKLRAHPRFDDPSREWSFRPVQGDLNASTGKKDMILTPRSTHGLWPVYKGASFNLFQPDTGEIYAWANPKHVTELLQARRRSSVSRAGSVWADLPPDSVRIASTLPCRAPRIAFRDVARATDSRTLICALIPPNVVVTHKAPYLLRVRGAARDEAFVLGVLSSIILDWYARRIVENSVTFEILNAVPLPRPPPDDPGAARVVEIAGRLAAADERYSTWAEEVGVAVGSVEVGEEAELIAELDARVAQLYGLDADDVRFLFETFHRGWDYEDRLAAVLEHFAASET
jgi:hypothetical protein